MDYFIGDICLFPYSFTPRGWIKCDGALLQIQQYDTLYALIGNKFGGDGRTNFGVPNLQGAEPIPDMSYYICVDGIFPSRT